MSEGSLFFEGRGGVQQSLARIVRRLEERGIPYAIAGGMALFLHGYRRFTEDVDILVTREGLQRIHTELTGLGYLRPFEKSKNLRDTESGVKIEFLVAGDYPGDGKSKSIAFPDPLSAAEVRNGVRVLGIAQLISLKIASGLTGAGRSKDLADVEELIKTLSLPESFSESVHPFSRERYLQIWRSLHATSKRYLLLWPIEGSTSTVQTLDELIHSHSGEAGLLEAMRDDGVIIDTEAATSDGYYRLVTNDPDVAGKYGMEEESEYWDLDGDSQDEQSAR